VGRGVHHVGQVLVGIHHEFDEQFVTSGEVPVQGGTGDTHLPRDRVQREPTRPGLGELTQGQALDLVPDLGPVPFTTVRRDWRHHNLLRSIDSDFMPRLSVTGCNENSYI
jgi:hypothetical protein